MREKATKCIRGEYVSCGENDGGRRCKSCGWSREEQERRRGIPLTRGENGLLRKEVGIGTEEGYIPDEDERTACGLTSEE